MAIPYLLRGKPEGFFNSNTIQPRTAILEAPSIDLAFVVEDNVRFDIKIEQQTICRAGDFVQVFTLMIALHYIFNVSYSKDVEESMIFFQKMFLEISDDLTIPTKMLTLIAKMKKKFRNATISLKVKRKKTFCDKLTRLVTLQTCYVPFNPFQNNVSFFSPYITSGVSLTFSGGREIGHLLEIASSERSKEVL